MWLLAAPMITYETPSPAGISMSSIVCSSPLGRSTPVLFGTTPLKKRWNTSAMPPTIGEGGG